MATHAVETLSIDFLKEWATLRAGTSAPSIQGRTWRGALRWGAQYSQMADDWKRKGLGRPPAFQDGKARPEQLLPGTPGARGAVWANTIPKGGSFKEGKFVRPGETDWTFWLLRCGRGFGKTETGAQAVIEWAQAGIGPILLAGATSMDVRASMVEGPGESALMKICPRDFTPDYEPSKRKLTFPNGVECQLLSAEEPERFRGVQFVKAWLDEFAAWTLLKECWDQIRYVMRVKRPGVRVQLVITTTPRTKPLIRTLSQDPRCVLTVRPTYDNAANLADEFREMILEDEGTRLGRQEIHGELLEDIEGALWSEETFDRSRLTWGEYEALLLEMHERSQLAQGTTFAPPERLGLPLVKVGVDPPGGRTECGISVAGRSRVCPYGHPGCKGHLFILADATEPESPSPARWAPAVSQAYHEYHADKVVAESNYGGDMVKHTISTEDSTVPVDMVVATRGKRVRAEPIANLWTGDHPRAHIVGRLAHLEGECTTFVPDQGQTSPNRMDAMVWAATSLMLEKQKPVAGPAGTARTSPWRGT